MAAAKIETRRAAAQRGQPGVHVGVAGAVDVAVLRVDERPALQHVPGRLASAIRASSTEMCALTGGRTRGHAPLGPDPTVEVVEDDGDDQRHDEDGQRPVHHEGEEGQLEDVEADVLVELRVLDAEAAAVAEQDPVLPLADRPGRGDQGQHEGERDVDPPGVGPHDLLVAPDQLVLWASSMSWRPSGRTRPG